MPRDLGSDQLPVGVEQVRSGRGAVTLDVGGVATEVREEEAAIGSLTFSAL